jgi:hypothetical protein
MKTRMDKCIFGCILLVLTLAGTAYGQTTFATITGTVTDPTGGVVPGATVTASNVLTGIKTTTKSNEAGIFTIAQLNEGTYSVTAEATGFRMFTLQKVVLQARDVRRVDVKLEVGAVETAVEVTGGATLIETETARISNTQNSVTLNTLPLNTRGLWAYLALAPNLQQQPGSSVIRFGGSRVNEENWSIDGTSFSDGVDNTQTGPLANYIESFQEVKIDLANNSAEFGSMGQVTIVSKSGTNDLHGAVFDYYITPWFRARDPFASARGTGITHQPGGAVGGPVWIPKVYNGRNKTFFFFSYETARGSAVSQNLTPTVAPSAWRTGDFSNLTDSIIDPTTGQPFGNNQIPADQINSVSKKIQDKFFPLPNYGDLVNLHGQNYRELKVRPYDPSTYWTTRIDHKFSDRDLVFGRYTWSRLYNRPWEGNLPTIGQRWQQRDDRAATVSYTHTFRPTLLNEFRWGFHFNNNPINYDLSKGSTQHGLDLVNELGLVGLAPDLPDINGILNMSFSNGITGLYQYPSRTKGYRTHTEELQEHVSWFRGRHNLKFGFNVLRSEWDSSGTPNALFGNVSFSARFTGQPYADFLLGIPTTASRAFPPVESDRNRWSYDFYALDDFKVSPKLTLNVGLRYELHLGWRENANRTSIFDVNSGNIVIPDGAMSKVSPIFPSNYVGIAEASSVGLPSRTLINNDLNNFAPRIGLAYRPWGTRTVFCAGFGIFYNVVPLAYALNFAGTPFILSEPSYTNPTDNPQVIFPRVFPSTGTGGPSTVGIPTAQNPDYRTPYSLQYNFTIEHEQWDTGFRLSYIGTGMRKAPWGYNYNAPIPNDQLFVNKPRAFPDYPDINYITNGAGHQYNGFTAAATRQMVGGLYMQGSWTWARDIYDEDYNWDYDGDQYIAENPLDRHRDIGPSRDIPTHRFNVNWIYQLPFGRGRHWGSNVSRLQNLLIGGWEFSGIFSAQSGQFLTPLWSGPDPVGISYTESVPAEVTIRPDIVKNPNLPSGQQTPALWFDKTAFEAPPVGRFGTSARGVIIGPGVNVWHMGFHKDFFFNEKTRLRWEMTAVNIFNHPNWANPSTDVTDSSFGEITSAGGATSGSTGDRASARQFRMGVRFQF